MDLVLINPRIVGTDKYPPISLLSIAAYARRNGCSVAIIDAQAEMLTDEEVSARIEHLKPILCGVTFMTSQTGIVRNLLAKLREDHPAAKFVAGGIHVSILPAEAKALGFDFCVVGEGEATLMELLSAVRNKTPTDSIKGLWIDGAQFRPREVLQDLDSLPLPAWDLVPIDRYTVSQPDLRYSLESGVCLTISASRGCPHNCAFCSSHGVYGYTRRTRSPKHIVDELELLCKKHGVTKFFLVDESILGNVERAQKFADEILDRGLKIMFASSARVSDPGVNLGTLTRMKKAGMVRVDFGVESGSQKILNDIRKGITIKQIETAHKIAHEAGMNTTSLMISGHLEESWEDVYDSLELVARIDTDFPEFGPMTPYPGTEAYAKATKEGWIRDSDWSKYTISNPYRVMRSRYFDYQEIYALSMLCTYAARFVTEWKHRNPSSWRDLYATLSTGPATIGIDLLGKLWLARYMQTRDRAFLQKVDLQRLKWWTSIRRRLFEDPENVALVIGVKKNPLRIIQEPNRIRRIRILMPLVFERISAVLVTLFVNSIRMATYAWRLRNAHAKFGTVG